MSFQIGAFKEEMKELRNRLNEAKKLDRILKDMNRAPIMKQVTSHTRFICELKTAIEVSSHRHPFLYC